MSATRNEDAVNAVSNQGEFRSRVERDEPLTTTGHKPGVKASPYDSVPESSAKTLPAGSAPASRTFQPNPTDEAPPVANYSSNADPDSERTSASDTMGGATSADVHTGLGHPGRGQTSSELRHDGEHHRKKQGVGLTGVGAGSMETGGAYNAKESINSHDPTFANQRGLDDEEASKYAGQRSNVGGPAAEERFPEGSERVAAEAPRDRSKIH